MKIIFYVYFLFLSFNLQAKESPYQSDVENYFDFNVKTMFMGTDENKKITETVEVLKKVFYSREFRERILGHKFNDQVSFHLNKGLSNEEIYDLLIEGAEELYPYKNFAMDVEIELYTDLNSNVLGYTKPSTRKIWINSKYFYKNTIAEVAGNLTHEWLHKLGFDHEKDKNDIRQFSVPYAIGNIVRDLVPEFDSYWNLDHFTRNKN